MSYVLGQLLTYYVQPAQQRQANGSQPIDTTKFWSSGQASVFSSEIDTICKKVCVCVCVCVRACVYFGMCTSTYVCHVTRGWQTLQREWTQ